MSESMDTLLAQAAENQMGELDETQLQRLSSAAMRQLHAEELVDTLEAQLKDAKSALTKMRSEVIPDLMDEVGMASFTLTNGDQIEIVPFYSASIPAERKPQAFDWLVEHGYEDLIKVKVEIPFQKAEYEKAQALAHELQSQGHEAVATMGVHPMTLKGWIRMMSEEGEEFPLDLFGAHIGRNTKIKRA